MNLQSLVVVALRLVALDFLLQVAIQLAPQLVRLGGAYSRLSATDASLPWVLLMGFIVGAVVIWRYAVPIARLVTAGLENHVSLGMLSLIDCYSIAFLGVGLSYMARHLSQVLNWAHYLFKAAASQPGDTWKEGLNGYDLSQAFIPFLLGLLLFLNGRKWAVALARRQVDGSPDASQNKEPDRDA